MPWLALLLCCTAALALPLPDEVDSEDTRKVLGSRFSRRNMPWLALLLCCTAALALPLPDEVDSEDTRKVLGSSVVTSVSVIMDLGNGTQAVLTDHPGIPVVIPGVGGEVGSPVDMATPDQYQYYSFDGSGNIIKRFMTKDDVSSIIATNHKQIPDIKSDVPTYYHGIPANIGDLALETTQDGEEPDELRVHNVVASVQNLLRSQMSAQGTKRPPMPTHISPEASASWSMILPSFFGNHPSVEEVFDDEVTIPSKTQDNTNKTQSPALINSHNESSTNKPTSESTLEKLDSVVVPYSESLVHIKNVTASSPTETPIKNVQSSESQMLGDAPVASDESSSTEREDVPTTKTKPETVQSTESMTQVYTTDKHTDLPEETTSSESMENVQSIEALPEISSTEYEIISTSNSSSTTVSTEVSSTPSQKHSQISGNAIDEVSSDVKTASVVSNDEQDLSSESSEEIEQGVQSTQLNNTLPPSESTTAGSGSGETLNDSVDDVSMLEDAPANSIEKDNLDNSESSKEKLPSATSEHEDDSVEQSTTNSAESEKHSNGNIPSKSTQHESNANVSGEQSSTESVEDVTKEKYDETTTSKEQTKNTVLDSQKDSTEDLEKISSSTEKLSITQAGTLDSNEDVDRLRDEESTDSAENVNTSGEKESAISSEETDSSAEQVGSEIVTVNSEESTVSTDKTKNTEETTQSAEDEVSSTSVELTLSTLPHKIKSPAKETHPATDVSTESTPSDDSKLDSLEGQVQADSPHLDKLGEPVSDLANIPVISEENHSNFNQVDMSSSSSKETIAAKTKNGSHSEVLAPTNKKDNVSSTATKPNKKPSSNDDSNVSASPAETTDTSSSTPEVTEESSEEQDSGKVVVVSHDLGEDSDDSGTATSLKGTTMTDDDISTTHNLDESVASIVSQITNGNIDSKIPIANSDSEDNQSTEIVVTSVSTSKSTHSTNTESSTEEGSGLNNICGLDSSCSVPEILDNSQESIDTDKISAGSESIEITSTFDDHNKTNVADSLVSSDEKLVTENPFAQTPSKLSEEGTGVLTTMITERTNTDVNSATPSSTIILTESGEIPISSESDAVVNKINETIKLTPPKESVKRCNKEGSGSDSDSESCDTNFVDSGDGSGSGGDSTEDSSIEGSGDETTSSSTKHSHIGVMDTTKASSESTDGSTSEDEMHDIMKYASSNKDIGNTNAPNYDTTGDDESNESSTTPDDYTQTTDKLNVDSSSTTKYEEDSSEFGTEKTMPSNDQPVEADVMDLFAYVNSNTDIGITNSNNQGNSESTEEPSSSTLPNESETSSENLNVDPNMDLFKYINSNADIGITNSYIQSESESTEPSSSTLSNESETSSENLNVDPNMDLFKYINSNADIGITNSYIQSESESTEPSSSTLSNESETSSENLSIDPNMDLFKYINSNADIGITNAYEDSETDSTEETSSTDINDVESTTAYDEEMMMNDQPVINTNDKEKVETVVSEHENLLKYSNANNSHLTPDYRHGALPQKAQKDDSINEFKHKPMFISPAGIPLNFEQEHSKLKRKNNTQQPDETNWTKVEVISPLASTTPTIQSTSTMKPAKETTHPDKPSHSESPSAAIHDVPHPPPHDIRPQFYSPSAVDLDPPPQESLGLEASTAHLVEDVQQFAELCNELAFKLWVSMTENSVSSSSRSLVMSPFAVTSLLAMIFLGAKGSTSGQMNDMLKLDDMMTFNPHQVFRNITESVVMMGNPGVRTAAFVRELYSDKGKGPLLDFYKQRASQFYDGLVEEADFANIGDIVRRRTNLLIRKQTGGRVPEYLRGTSLSLQPPLAAFSANIFQTECRGASTQGRDGEMYFTILPQTRQRRLVPIPSAVFRSGFLAGYEPSLDATVVSLGTQDSAISTLFVLPGQQGTTAPGDGLSRLEARLLATAYTNRAWSRLLRSLLQRPGMEVQIPRFSHRSLLNITHSLQSMGLNELFSPSSADLKGLSGAHSALHVSDLVQINTFTTCGEEVIGSRHHVEIHPSAPQRAGRDHSTEEQDLDNVPLVSRPRQARLDLSLEPSGFEEAVPQAGVLDMPLALRPRQARLPDGEESLPRLKFDRPFLYFVRHNPTGFILHMGRFNPRLIH